MKSLLLIICAVAPLACGNQGTGTTSSPNLESSLDDDRAREKSGRDVPQRFTMDTDQHGTITGEAVYRTVEPANDAHSPAPMIVLFATSSTGEFVTIELDQQRGTMVVDKYDVALPSSKARVMFTLKKVEHAATSGSITLMQRDRHRVGGVFNVNTEDGVGVSGEFSGKLAFDCSIVAVQLQDGMHPGVSEDGAVQWTQDNELQSNYCKRELELALP